MHSFRHHSRNLDEHSPLRTQGTFVNTPAWLYDLMVEGAIYHGKGQQFRQMILGLAQLQLGESVLDVGCGTGTLALEASKHVGKTGRVSGIDPSAQLLVGARRKAKRASLPIDFQSGQIERIPFPDQSFDVVLSTFVLHHVPDDLKRQGLSEIVRVLKPAGRLLVIDFRRSEEREGLLEHVGADEIDLGDLPALMKDAGFFQTKTGETPLHVRSLAVGHQKSGFVLAKKSLTQEKRTNV